MVKKVKLAKIKIGIPIASTDIELPPLAEPPGAGMEKLLFYILFVVAHQMWENTYNCPNDTFPKVLTSSHSGKNT